MKRFFIFILALCLLFNGSLAETYTLDELARILSAVKVDGIEYTVKYYEENKLFKFCMKSTLLSPESWAVLDGKTKTQHYLDYIEMEIKLEDMIAAGGYTDVAVATSFQLSDGTPIYLAINGIDCSNMIS